VCAVPTAVPSTVETVRSGDHPTGNTAAADQSAAAAEVTGNLEDIEADRRVAAVQQAAEVGEAEPGAGPSGAGQSLGGAPEPEPGQDRQDRTEPDHKGPTKPEPEGAEPGADEQGPGDSSAGPGENRPDLARARRARAGAALRQPRSKHRVLPLNAWPLNAWPWARAGMLPRIDRQRKDPDVAGATFARLTVLPTLLVMAWLLVGLPLLLAGVFLPAPTLLVAVPVAVALGAGLRRSPGRWPRALAGGALPAGPRQEPAWPAWWGLAGTIVVAAGFAAWQFLFNSETVIVLRDPGAYLQTGYWIAQHASLPIPQSLAAFGGAHPGLGFSSVGFSARGTSVVPELMSGLPLLLAGGFWVHGTAAAAAMGPVLGGLAVLAFGGLVGRLAGPQWAPAGALVLGFTLPEQYTSRGSFSETVAQVLLFGGLSLVADGLTLDRAHKARGSRPEPQGLTGTRALPAVGGWRSRLRALSPGRHLAQHWPLMALGGLALGLTAVVRVDGLLDVLPAIPFLGILFARRSSTTIPFGIGLIVGAGYGLADGYLLARPLLDSLQPLPELIGLLAAWLAALTLAAVELLRMPGFRRRLRTLLARRPVRWLPDLGAALAVAALTGLVIRPYLQIVRQPANRATAGYVASLQRLEHLPVDPGRLYAEDTLYWVIWYVGLPAVLLGGFGLALLVGRCLRALLSWQDPSGTVRIWALPLAIICWGSAAVLWQPETVPDQPWASRRLVPLVVPGLILLAIWASASLRARARSRGAGNTAASLVAACCVAALLLPTVATTFGLGLTHSGKSGALQPTADGLALKRTGQGQVGAVNALCSSLGPSASVLIVDRLVAEQFSQVIRGMCGVPVASMIGQSSGSVQAVLGGMERAGHRPVLLAARPAELYAYGGSPVRILDLSTTQDPHTLTQPPTAPWPAHYVIWMSAPGSFGARV
jgi:hypothetical protein